MDYEDFQRRLEYVYDYLDSLGIKYYDARHPERHPEPVCPGIYARNCLGLMPERGTVCYKSRIFSGESEVNSEMVSRGKPLANIRRAVSTMPSARPSSRAERSWLLWSTSHM